MDKDVLAAFLRDEAEALAVVEPLHRALRHEKPSLCYGRVHRPGFSPLAFVPAGEWIGSRTFVRESIQRNGQIAVRGLGAPWKCAYRGAFVRDGYEARCRPRGNASPNTRCSSFSASAS